MVAQEYEAMELETLFYGMEIGHESTTSVLNGDVSKPISFYVQAATDWYKVWEYAIGVQINFDDGSGFGTQIGLENTLSFSDGTTEVELITGLNKIGYTVKYDVDFGKHTASSYEHVYLRSIPTAGALVATYYSCGVAGGLFYYLTQAPIRT